MFNHLCKIIPLTLVVCVLLNGCGGSSATNNSVEIEGLIIYNGTEGPLDDISLNVENTGEVVSCSFIPSKRTFSTKFPLRRYQGNSITVSYRKGGITRETGQLFAETPERLVSGRPVYVVVAIAANGRVTARLKQGRE